MGAARGLWRRLKRFTGIAWLVAAPVILVLAPVAFVTTMAAVDWVFPGLGYGLGNIIIIIFDVLFFPAIIVLGIYFLIRDLRRYWRDR